MKKENFSRRKFISTLGISTFTVGNLILPRFGHANPFIVVDKNINHIGPMEGFTPQIGTLISMLDWVSETVIQLTKKLTVEQLDYLHDNESNSIGALMLHVAATEVIYQDITFYNLDGFSTENKDKWNVAMELGADAQHKIKGNKVEYYVDAMNEARAKTKMMPGCFQGKPKTGIGIITVSGFM
jgi:3D (Asp-Asp-Asp) domain-containing protein